MNPSRPARHIVLQRPVLSEQRALQRPISGHRRR